jgi:hypothetical protein
MQQAFFIPTGVEDLAVGPAFSTDFSTPLRSGRSDELFYASDNPDASKIPYSYPVHPVHPC